MVVLMARGSCFAAAPLWNPSITSTRTGNQSTASLSADAAGPVPATMNGLSAALKDASLFNDKFRNVWIFFHLAHSGPVVQLGSDGGGRSGGSSPSRCSATGVQIDVREVEEEKEEEGEEEEEERVGVQ